MFFQSKWVWGREPLSTHPHFGALACTPMVRIVIVFFFKGLIVNNNNICLLIWRSRGRRRLSSSQSQVDLREMTSSSRKGPLSTTGCKSSFLSWIIQSGLFSLLCWPQIQTLSDSRRVIKYPNCLWFTFQRSAADLNGNSVWREKEIDQQVAAAELDQVGQRSLSLFHFSPQQTLLIKPLIITISIYFKVNRPKMAKHRSTEGNSG